MTGDDAYVDAYLLVFLLDSTECDLTTEATSPVTHLRVIAAFSVIMGKDRLRWGLAAPVSDLICPSALSGSYQTCLCGTDAPPNISKYAEPNSRTIQILEQCSG